jgi:hypothetical protein
MSNTAYAVVADTATTIGATLASDGVTADLTSKTIACTLENTETDVVISVSGTIGGTGGAVSTVIAGADLVAGRWRIQWSVDGLTYPQDGNRRPVLVVRPEVN